jgi:hypothetical protein
LPVTEAKKKKLRYATLRSANACCSTTDDTPDSHARSGVSFAGGDPPGQLRVGDVRLSVGPRLLACPQPVVENHPRAPERPRQPDAGCTPARSCRRHR